MTPPRHKILLYGSIVTEPNRLPIGSLSEKAAEVRSKHISSEVRFVIAML